MKKLIFLLSLGLIVLIGSFFWYEKTNAPLLPLHNELTFLAPDGTVRYIKIEIADDDTERAQGLMFREKLEEGTGMLFVFDAEMPLSFWMKHTLIPLDILFFDKNGKFVSRTSMTPCTTDPCASYPSAGPALYAVEVNAGESVTLPIGEGWTLSK